MERNKKAKAEKVGYVNQLKSEPCMDCGVRYPPYVMDFDHRDPLDKVASVSSLMTKGWAVVLAEIAKCDLVCSNCHRIRTHSRVV